MAISPVFPGITWLTQGGFLFESSGFRLVIDPYMSNHLAGRMTRLVDFPLSLDELRPDMVLCTHDHLDHLDPETITMIAARYPDCRFSGSENAFQHLLKLGIRDPLLLEIGRQVMLGPFHITPVFALHSDPAAVGIVIESDNTKIYLTADTEYDGRLFSKTTSDPDLVLICINGRLGNMTWQEAVRVVTQLKPRIALPMHYGLFAQNTENPVPFIDACARRGIISFEMPLGKELAI